MTQEIGLEEYATSGPHALSPGQRSVLAKILPSLTIEPADAKAGEYYLTPGSTVGAIDVEDLSVLIRPKIGIPQLISLVCFATSKLKLRPELFDYSQHHALPDFLALALASAARRAFSRGLFHGYRTEEQALLTVRGRVRAEDQMRRRFDIVLPVEVRYDEFTEDVLANRLVKAAALRLSGSRLRGRQSRNGLGWLSQMLGNVSTIEFLPFDVPEVRFDRLNDHYREVVGLSRIVLKYGAFESHHGEIRASGFLMDMDAVFQEFVTQALRESLGVSERVFREAAIPSLDEEDRARLRPDLTWGDGTSVWFVGDAKYKNLANGGVREADLYQLLAYVTASNLPAGLLVYAEGEATAGIYIVRHWNKRLEIATLDLSGNLDDVLARVSALADKVKAFRREAEELVGVAQ